MEIYIFSLFAQLIFDDRLSDFQGIFSIHPYLHSSIKIQLTKGGRVGEVIKQTIGTITKAEIMKKCPDISQITIQKRRGYYTLYNDLKKSLIFTINSFGRDYETQTWNVW